MATRTVNKHQLRTEETISRLLQAAEEVFIRDGYEAAQLEEIAKKAKRTKGSVYGNFKSKEHLFLALVEHRFRGYLAKLEGLMEGTTSVKQRRQILRTFYIEEAADSNWSLLSLEFKLFAVRHARSKQRLKKVMTLFEDFEKHYPPEDSFGLRKIGPKVFSAGVDILGSVGTAIALEAAMNPEILSVEVRQRILGIFFDAITE